MHNPPQPLDLRQRIVGHDQLVPLLDGSLVPYVNLDNAASTPALQDAMDAVERFMPYYASVHRGTGFKSRLSTVAYDQAHEIVGAVRRRGPAHEHGDLRQEHHRGHQQALLPPAGPAGPRRHHHPARASLQRPALARPLPGRPRAGRCPTAGWTRTTSTACWPSTPAGSRWWPSPAPPTSAASSSRSTAWRAKAHAAGARILVDAAQLAPHRQVDMKARRRPGAPGLRRAFGPQDVRPLRHRRADRPQGGLPAQRAGVHRRRHGRRGDAGRGVLGRACPTARRPAAPTWSAQWPWPRPRRR